LLRPRTRKLLKFKRERMKNRKSRKECEDINFEGEVGEEERNQN
jgi:hypothetical protein